MDNATSNDELQKTHHILRIADIDIEPFETLTSIDGCQNVPLVSLKIAVKPLVSFLPDIQSYASIAIERCRTKPPVDRLSNNESASIMLYTMGWKPLDQCLHIALNKILRSKERNQLEPWLLYLKLFFTARSHLPSCHQTIYRVVEFNLSEYYKTDETVVWWAFSSCATSIDALQSEQQILNTTDARTLFTIQSISGKTFVNILIFN